MVENISHNKKKIYEFILDSFSNNYFVDENINNEELYLFCKKNKLLKKFKNFGELSFLIVEDKDDRVIILNVLEFDIIEKDSIKINEIIVKSIDLLEKNLIELNSVKIQRIDNYTLDKHVVIIKCVRIFDDILSIDKMRSVVEIN